MQRIVKRPAAEQDLREIWQYIAQSSLPHADNYIRKLHQAFETLSAFPLTGRPRSELQPELRSFPCGGHTVFYLPLDGGIEVFRVLHAARDIPSLFRQD